MLPSYKVRTAGLMVTKICSNFNKQEKKGGERPLFKEEVPSTPV